MSVEEEPETEYAAEAWRLAKVFFEAVEAGGFVVEAVEVSAFAEVTVRLTEGVVIESFNSTGQYTDLWWCMNEATGVSALVGMDGTNFGKGGCPMRFHQL